jgi:hypothetical protein
VKCCCWKLVTEAWENFGNLDEREHPPLKPLPSNGSEDVTVDTRVCVTVYSEV